MTTAIVAQAVPSSPNNVDRYAALDVFAQSLSHIANDYVEPVEERALIYSAVQGMAASLDRHSAFLSPDRYQRLREDTEGEYGGVGITLQNGLPREPVVGDVAAGSPASRAGILAGDLLLAVDGHSTTVRPGKRMDALSWHSRLRGVAGTRVELLIMRESWPKPRSFVLVREHIKVPSVDSLMVEPGIGYLAITRFQEATAADVAAALTGLGKDSLDALILDLRDNPGGIVEQAVRVADLFLEQGTITVIRGRDAAQVERQVAHSPGTWARGRMVVLINQNTASAAEIVAGALQDHGRATILGAPSYGKGSVQTFIDLRDGSGLKLTTARYYTPRERSLENIGITPDMVVEAFEGEVIWPEKPMEPEADIDEPDDGRPGTLRDRLVGDRQFEAAHQTIKVWLGSKQAGQGR